MKTTKTLLASGNNLAQPAQQLDILNNTEQYGTFTPFATQLQSIGLYPLHATGIKILQINVGKRCNQTCKHCHVDAGPDRRETMSLEIMQKCLKILADTDIQTVDITGGAPELHPHFRWFVQQAAQMGKHIINRCNLTIIRSNPKFYDLPQFFAQHRVEIVSSLPHYAALRTDSQRGDGVFAASIEALQLLNQVGYGQPNSGLLLNLVYNPSGAFLPAPQHQLEAEFKRQLASRYNISFNQLFAITNMPISRFLDYLLTSGNYTAYMQQLLDAFNPAAAQNVMCRNTLSVSYDGYLYDCDFNQMLQLHLHPTMPQHVNQFNATQLNHRPITLNQHCYGCTAGAGSSCAGNVANQTNKTNLT
ncbi:MAG: arsenosugar biosynthesis radical SAM protein ArsS [Sphingobacteriales bacterium]|nr:arsenosugar biosynthesis radical SAM protein ArsS [Sphingobacteriales bacterium]